jgi:hypothetical protein
MFPLSLSLISSPPPLFPRAHPPTAQGIRPCWRLCRKSPRSASFLIDIPWSRGLVEHPAHFGLPPAAPSCLG